MTPSRTTKVSRLWDEIGYWAPLNARQIEMDFLFRLGRDLGTQQLTVEGIDVWPLATFLEALAADRLWP